MDEQRWYVRIDNSEPDPSSRHVAAVAFCPSKPSRYPCVIFDSREAAVQFAEAECAKKFPPEKMTGKDCWSLRVRQTEDCIVWEYTSTWYEA